eukprot:m.102408 g.102408  ORF g.102408 m.102408 type:complete len:88 (-) comp13773_c0_seq1:1068-1331(-)
MAAALDVTKKSWGVVGAGKSNTVLSQEDTTTVLRFPVNKDSESLNLKSVLLQQAYMRCVVAPFLGADLVDVGRMTFATQDELVSYRL